MARKAKVKAGDKPRKFAPKKSFSKVDKARKVNKKASAMEVDSGSSAKKKGFPATVVKPTAVAVTASKISSSKSRRLRKFKAKMNRYLTGDQSVKPSKAQLKRLDELKAKGWEPNMVDKKTDAVQLPQPKKKSKQKSAAAKGKKDDNDGDVKMENDDD